MVVFIRYTRSHRPPSPAKGHTLRDLELGPGQGQGLGPGPGPGLGF